MTQRQAGRDARRSQSRVLAFLRNDSGTVTIFAIIAFAMLIAFIGLVFDVGRVMNIHSQANSYADRVALAAAAELDRRPNSLDRAVAAAQGAIAQVDPGLRITLSGDDEVQVRRLTFLSDLGPDSNDPYARSPLAGDVVTATWEEGTGLVLAAGVTANQAVTNTTFVLVDVTRETEQYILFPLFAGLFGPQATEATVAPQAVAGFKRTLCNYPPIFICNLAEATGGIGAPFDPVRGQMIKAKAGGGAAGWGPGNFGLIDAPDGQGAAAIREYMARVDPNTPCTDEVINTKPGANTGPTAQGMNVRFDMYDGPMNGNRNNSQYAPSANVLKGRRLSGQCPGNSASTLSTPFPRDNCFMPPGTWPAGIPAGSGTGCTVYGSIARAGDGTWNRNGYWGTNHPGQAQPSGYATMTRYEVYRHEIETPNLVNRSPQERGAPSCSGAAPISDASRDRRVLPVAVVNCRADPPSGSTDLQDVIGYMEVFLTEPVGNDLWWCTSPPCNQDIFVEVISMVRANTTNSVLREYPVLYR